MKPQIAYVLATTEYDATPNDLMPSEILIDIIGLGAGVYDRCMELGLPVRGINVGEAAASRERRHPTASITAHNRAVTLDPLENSIGTLRPIALRV